ncbi:BPSS1187 family protein [Roseimaritima sediminicola]|uniref:BPSS1187 family protein n=1 Tax=Roseimaritima sediminicola TaxID=2662066 RepID=UPI001F16BE8F|nr:DUF4886 domain-containing protein [Roseimaritima sediminicola]
MLKHPLTFRIPTALLCFVALLVSDWAAAAAPAAGSDGNAARSPKHVRVLTVGNSFTRNATEYLDELAAAAGYQLTLKSLYIGGSPLELHARKALAFEQDREDPLGTYRGGESLQQALQSEAWDFVTIQQVSIQSHDIQTYRPHAEQLARIVHRYAPQAQLLIHQTWAYRQDDPRFQKTNPAAGEPTTQQAMYEGLREAYRAITAELSAKRIPVGDAFWIADNDPHFGYQPPAKDVVEQAQPPALPPQEHSLHVGYRWRSRDGKQVLRMDGHHASLAGEYLGSCVWFACLFDDSPVGNRFVPSGLPLPYATHLQQIAQRAVQNGDDVVRGKAVETTAFDDPSPQRYEFRVRASEIDPRVKEYPEIGFVFGSADKPADLQHAAVDTRVAPRGRLAIWLMGHNSGLFERWNQYGIHAIDVSYARAWFGKLAQPEPADGLARGKIRLEAATGLDVSDELDLQLPDGAAERARQLLLWLVEQNPQGNWEQFLADDGSRVRWDKVIITGASHGSTTAARFAKHQRVARVVMLCGPRDQDQDWQALPSATPANRFFGFTHVLDGGWTGHHYDRSWRLLGLNAFGGIVNVDQVPPPYQHSRQLISAADVGGDARRAHSAVTPGGSSPEAPGGGKLYDPVWRYLYTHDVDKVGSPERVDFSESEE